MDSENKAEALARIDHEIENCKICPVDKIGRAVPGEGSPNADIVFIGEAPGKTEAQTGRPFVGRSGKFLRKNIAEIGLKEEDVYITSPVKYLPLRGTPTPADIAHGRTHLVKQLEIINPSLVVLMGRVAAEGVLQEKIAIAKEHGTTITRAGKKYFLIYHPAAAIRFQKLRAVFESDFAKLRNI